MSSKLKLSDAIKAISNNTSQTLVKAKKKTEKKPAVVIEDDNEQVDDSKFNESFDVGKKKGDVTYKKLQLHEQILLRPDTYIGSCKNIPSSDPIYVKVGEHIKEKNITYPAFYLGNEWFRANQCARLERKWSGFHCLANRYPDYADLQCMVQQHTGRQHY